MRHLVSGLEKCTGLQRVYIGVDEAHIVEAVCRSLHHKRHLVAVYMRPEEIDGQLNMLVLRQSGMDKLRGLRIPEVEFKSFIERRHVLNPPTTGQATVSGPIPGGILETVIAKEMMHRTPSLQRKRGSENMSETAGPVKHARTGRPRKAVPPSDAEDDNNPTNPTKPIKKTFMDLSPEVRNEIYACILIVDGKINPSTAKPTSIARKRKAIAPPSVLALLQTSKTVFNEAVGIHYARNRFVFYTPAQLLMFLASISDQRKAFINDITLWYKDEAKSDVYMIDVALQTLKSLPNLKKLDLIVESLLGPGFNVSSIRGEDLVRDLSSKGVDVHIKSLYLARIALDGFSMFAMFWTAQAIQEYRRIIADMEKKMRGEVDEEQAQNGE